ncbi:MAG: signal recognition particle protein [Acidimicrobiales bacterium]|nr:MAG: signal recognition particle protein [Acidimicrobiales bacterium]
MLGRGVPAAGALRLKALRRGDSDVNFEVVKSLIGRIRERSVGDELSKALNPTQQIVKIVLEELTQSLGGEAMQVTFEAKPPTVVLMAGLQGSGKTTNSAKLANLFKSQGRNPLLVGADLQRPAAVEQLRTLGAQIDVPVFSEASDPVQVARSALVEAKRLGRDVIICDTAGRLAIDTELMEEVRQISEVLNPHYTFLVVDAMTGQDAVTVAESFHTTLALDGVILTKLDGDARGGAALSVKEVVGRPIAFASTGEKIDEFEVFYPDRLASRILGMGDIETLIEKAEAAYDEDEAEEAAQRLLEGSFTLEDFLQQMQQIKKMGPLGNLIGMMPGMPKEVRDVEIEDSQVARLEAIIRSMTPEERAKPQLIDGSRRQRIANGSGAQPQDVSGLVKQFAEMQKMMKQFGMTPKKPKRKGGKKSKKRRGGRTTAKGPAPMADPSILLNEGMAELESLPGSLRLPGLPED